MLQNGFGEFGCMAFHCKIGHRLYQVAGTEMDKEKFIYSNYKLETEANSAIIRVTVAKFSVTLSVSLVLVDSSVEVTVLLTDI